MDWAGWIPRIEATLMFIIRGGQILLIRKKRGLGAGKINGPGGKIDPGETPLDCAIRETREELGVEAIGAREIGVLHFQFTDGMSIRCHVFLARDCHGEARETDEAIPMWTPLDAIPLDEMWDDDRYWIPLLLAERPFKGWFEFDGDRMLTREIVESPMS